MSWFPNIARAAFLIITCASVTACQQGQPSPKQANAGNSVASPVHNAAEQVLTPEPPMDRAAVLDAVAKARSAAAAGVDDSGAQKQLDGKAFEFRIRFGCAGPDATNGATLGWSLHAKSGVLRVHAAPDISKDDPIIAKMDLQTVEAVEGMWIDRPWLLQATCPATSPTPPTAPPATVDGGSKGAAPAPIAAAPPQPLPAAPKVGIAQFFTASDPRTARHGDRPYEAVKKVDDAGAVGQQGFDLVFSGRLEAIGGGRVIRCLAASPDAPPACVVSASFDHVWIEDAGSKDRIADWSSS